MKQVLNLCAAVLLSASAGLLPGLASAQDTAPPATTATPIEWSSLSEAERSALAAFAQEWHKLQPHVQQQLRRGAARWSQMNPEQRVESAERFARWQQLDETRREQIRQRFEAFRHLPPEQQRELRRAFEQFRNLPPRRRQELLQRFSQMGPQEREAFLLALRARAEAGRTNPQRPRMWDFVPPAERGPTIEMMRALPRDERRALRAMVEPLSPMARNELRSKLLEMTPGQRRAFLLRGERRR